MYGAAGGRRLMGPWLRWSPTSQGEERSESLKKKIRDTVDKLAARLDDNAHEDGWKLLHRSKHGEEHEMVFEDGHKVRVHMLLA